MSATTAFDVYAAALQSMTQARPDVMFKKQKRPAGEAAVRLQLQHRVGRTPSEANGL
jgi:hypothetical protein